MNNERITVPELLFYPSDIGTNLFFFPSCSTRDANRTHVSGLNQAGIHEAIVQAVNCTQSYVHPQLYANVRFFFDPLRVARPEYHA
jgi:hypothetical protein